MTEKKPQKPSAIAVGHEWTVTVDKDVREVTFVSPDGDEYLVSTVADGHGQRTAVIVLTQPGEWTAGDGEHSVTAK